MSKLPPLLSHDLIGKRIIGAIVVDGTCEILLFGDGNALIFERDPMGNEVNPYVYWKQWKP